MSTGGNNDVNSTLLITADSTKGTKVNAGVVAKPFRDEIKRKVERLRSNGIGTCKQQTTIVYVSHSNETF